MGILKKILDFVMDILETVTFVGSIFVVVYLFIMQPNQVKGASMVPTFEDQDYIFTSKVSYHIGTPQFGDVVVFKSPKNPDIEYIKRIIGVPGDTVEIRGEEVYLNNTILDETYISGKYGVTGGFAQDGVAVTVPEGYYYVLGDNRSRSSDSRDFGPIPKDSIVGLVFYRYFPVSKAGWIHNPYQAQ